MIPKYPFIVEVTRKLGGDMKRETHNYETLDGAYSYSAIVMKKPGTKRVKVLVIISDVNPERLD